MIANTPGTDELLESHWRRATWFYARFRITESLVRNGVPATDPADENPAERVGSPIIWMADVRAR